MNLNEMIKQFQGYWKKADNEQVVIDLKDYLFKKLGNDYDYRGLKTRIQEECRYFPAIREVYPMVQDLIKSRIDDKKSRVCPECEGQGGTMYSNEDGSGEPMTRLADGTWPSYDRDSFDACKRCYGSGKLKY
jgi:hypothetical protein